MNNDQRPLPLTPAEEAHHYFVGLSPQTDIGGLARIRGYGVKTLPASAVYPRSSEFHHFMHPIISHLNTDPSVREITLRSVLGRYGTSQELSVGLEVRASTGFDVASFAAATFRQAQVARQTDAFVCRRLKPGEWTDNARPGLTLLFNQPRRINEIQGVVHTIMDFPGEGWPIDGFTTIPGPVQSLGSILGIRYVFFPEISLRWDIDLRLKLLRDVEEVDVVLIDQSNKIGRLTRELRANKSIAEARLDWFDVIVAGMEDYAGIVTRLMRCSGIAVSSARTMARAPLSEMLELDSACVIGKRLSTIDLSRASDAEFRKESCSATYRSFAMMSENIHA